MKGSIRFFLGLLIVYGAMGTLDYDPQASVLVQGLFASAGLLLMCNGVLALKQS